MATDTAQPALKKGDRVVATESLRGVPEGTAGKLGRAGTFEGDAEVRDGDAGQAHEPAPG